MNNQNPCGEILATSTSEVRFPRFADFIFVLSDEFQRGVYLPFVQAVILSQLDSRFQPEFCFPG
jgi:hypothetical protein